MGCLVTERVDFPEEPFCPPSVTTRPGADFPVDSIIIFDLDDTPTVEPDAGTGGSQELVFEVLVRDCNVNQPLRAQLAVDLRPEFGGVLLSHLDLSVERTGSDSRPFDDALSRDELLRLDPGCHRVDMFVSEQFGPIGEPVRSGDLGTAVWWLGILDEANREDGITLSECPR